MFWKRDSWNALQVLKCEQTVADGKSMSLKTRKIGLSLEDHIIKFIHVQRSQFKTLKS